MSLGTGDGCRCWPTRTSCRDLRRSHKHHRALWERRKSRLRGNFLTHDRGFARHRASCRWVYGAGMSSEGSSSGYKTLRKGRWSVPGQIYLVTTICANRHPCFKCAKKSNVVSAKLMESGLWGDSRLLCWVLMPDHMHALIELGQERTLSALMQRVKAVSALAVQRSGGISGQFWMPGFHDRALRAEESVREAAAYILHNPVRAGLVAAPREYPYLWAVWDDALDGTI